jgi:hypothetical protein
MIMNTNFLTPYPVYLCITTATVAAQIIGLNIVFFMQSEQRLCPSGILASQKAHAAATVLLFVLDATTNNTEQAGKS